MSIANEFSAPRRRTCWRGLGSACAIVLALVEVCPADSTQAVFARHSDLVAQVRVIDRRSDSKAVIGSGFFVTPRLLVTNFHVISGVVHYPERYRVEVVRTSDNASPLRLVNVDVVHDLAILECEEPNTGDFELDTELPPKGARIYALGNPYDLGSSIVEGTCNGLLKETLYEKIHFTGALNPGMSGGPAIAESGRVIGVNVSGMGNSVGFLVPAKFVTALLNATNEPTYHPPTTFVDAVRDQLLAHQDQYMPRLLAKPFEPMDLGSYRLPKKLGDFTKCWGDSRLADEARPFDRTWHTCASEDSIFLTSKLSAGSVDLQHKYLSTSSLNRFQFAAIYQSWFEDDDVERNRRHQTRYRCHTDFVAISGGDWKVVTCLRAYRMLAGLYDVALKAASVNDNFAGVQTRLHASAVSFDNAMLLSRRYLEALQWRK